MRPAGSPQQLEKRRHQAVRLLQKGISMAEVAKEVGASISSVFRWQEAFRKNGSKGLEGVPATGRPPKLSPRQKRKLIELLIRGPVALGYSTDFWTTRRVAEVIGREFRIDYHPNHIWRVLVGLGWSYQKPERRARERDEAAKEEWKKGRGAAIKKTLACGAHLVLLDESGYLLLPHVVRTWAPRGRTPILRHFYRRDRVSVISAVTLSPKRRRCRLFFRVHPRNIKAGA